MARLLCVNARRLQLVYLAGMLCGVVGCVTLPGNSPGGAADARLVGTWAGEGEREAYRLIFRARGFSLERGEWVQSKGTYDVEGDVLRFRVAGAAAAPEDAAYRLEGPDTLVIVTAADGAVTWRREGPRAPGAFPELEAEEAPTGLFAVVDDEEAAALAERRAAERGLGEAALDTARGVAQSVGGGIKRTGQRVIESLRSDVAEDPPDEIEDVGRTIAKARITVEDTAREEWRETVSTQVGGTAPDNQGPAPTPEAPRPEAASAPLSTSPSSSSPSPLPPAASPASHSSPSLAPAATGGLVVDVALAERARAVARGWAADARLVKITARCGTDGLVDLARFPDGASFWFGSPAVPGGFLVSAMPDGGMAGNPLPGMPLPAETPEVPQAFVPLPEAAAVLRAHGETDPVLPMALERLGGGDGWYWWTPKAGVVAEDLVAVHAATGQAVPYEQASGREAARDLAEELARPRPLATARYAAIREAADALARRWHPEMALFMVYLAATQDANGQLEVRTAYFDYMGPGETRGARVVRVAFQDGQILSSIADSDFVGAERMPALPRDMLSADEAFTRLARRAGAVDGVFGLDALSVTERPPSYGGGGIMGLHYDIADESRLTGRSVWRLNQQVIQAQVLQPNLRGGSPGGVFDRSHGTASYIDAVTGEAL
jgi:hypothetical protein